MTRDKNDALLTETIRAVEAAGNTLLARFGTTPRPATLADLLAGIQANDRAVEGALRDALLAALPGSRWAEDEEAEGALPAGDWWVADPAEGNVNHLHGRPGWAVTATLVRDGEPVLTVISVPLTGETYSAITGRGAFVNGRPLEVSAKRDIAAAIVASGQARPGEARPIRAAMIRSAERLLDTTLLVRLSVPSMLELIDVAAGRLDSFWQHGSVRAGLMGGALLVREAGGDVTDLRGHRWAVGSPDFLAAPPALQPAILAALSSNMETLA
ncbi:inositol monophosphatase family protein [Sphingomonas sp. 22176]|uniref:inositol monophosphatase family protein n=1 Tax=Sphingomonas sp. 22176 TaxID=3453884 RepID=UPI003F8697FB